MLVCTTNPDKPGPPSAPCVTAATPYGFTVTWGKGITVQASVYSSPDATAVQGRAPLPVPFCSNAAGIPGLKCDLYYYVCYFILSQRLCVFGLTLL